MNRKAQTRGVMVVAKIVFEVVIALFIIGVLMRGGGILYAGTTDKESLDYFSILTQKIEQVRDSEEPLALEEGMLYVKQGFGLIAFHTSTTGAQSATVCPRKDAETREAPRQCKEKGSCLCLYETDLAWDDDPQEGVVACESFGNVMLLIKNERPTIRAGEPALPGDPLMDDVDPDVEWNSFLYANYGLHFRDPAWSNTPLKDHRVENIAYFPWAKCDGDLLKESDEPLSPLKRVFIEKVTMAGEGGRVYLFIVEGMSRIDPTYLEICKSQGMTCT